MVQAKPTAELDVSALASNKTETRDKAWQHLCESHYKQLYRLVCRFGVEPGEVEDLVQRALVITFERLQETEEVRNPGAWIRGITVRVVLHHLRWRKLREAKRWVLPDSPIAPQPVITPEQCVSAAEEIESVRTILKKMSPKLRNILVLCDIEGLKPGEVSRHLGLSVETIRSRRRLAKEQFMKFWQREYP